MAAADFEDVENGSVIAGKPSTASLKLTGSQPCLSESSNAAVEADLLEETARDAERQGELVGFTRWTASEQKAPAAACMHGAFPVMGSWLCPRCLS